MYYSTCDLLLFSEFFYENDGSTNYKEKHNICTALSKWVNCRKSDVTISFYSNHVYKITFLLIICLRESQANYNYWNCL